MIEGRACGTRVFVAEDEALVRLMLVEMITDFGHEVVAQASTLDTAIKFAMEADYQLAVLDLNLGRGITYEVADIVLGRGKALVLSTGYGTTGLSLDYKGCVVVQKPFTRDALCRAMELSCQRLGAGNSQEAASSV